MNNDWLDIELLEDYLDGKLDSKAMHRIEKQALEDPFVAQALAGLSQSPKRAANTVSLLQKQLYDRIAQQEIVKKESVFTWQRLSVAAAAAVMFISVSIIFFMRDEERREQQARINNRSKTVEVNLAPSPAGVDSARANDYAASTKVAAPSAVGIGKISPAREAHPAPNTSVYVQPHTAVEADRVDTVAGGVAKAENTSARMSARVAAVVPAAAAPIGGWAGLDSYLADNNRLSKGTKLGKFVELSFMIDNDGAPADIKVSKGATEEIDAEAIRLIKEGPTWEQPRSAGSRVTYTVAF